MELTRSDGSKVYVVLGINAMSVSDIDSTLS